MLHKARVAADYGLLWVLASIFSIPYFLAAMPEDGLFTLIVVVMPLVFAITALLTFLFLCLQK